MTVPAAAARPSVRRVVCAALFVAWCAAVWRVSASSDPMSLLGVAGMDLPDWLGHGMEFAVGGFFAAGAVRADMVRADAVVADTVVAERRLQNFALPVLLCALWGAVDEVHQGFVPGRQPSGMDLAVDVAGAALGALAFAAILRGGRAAADPAEQGR